MQQGILDKAFIFGAGSVGKTVLSTVQSKYTMLGYIDNDKTKWGTVYEGFEVFNPESILTEDYQMIIVATLAGVDSVVAQLLQMGVEHNRISTEYVDLTVKSRISFLEKLGAMFHEQNIEGSVAECGVFLGEFAKEINRIFPARKLYLFDTFSGFDKKDIYIEQEKKYSHLKAGHFNITSEQLVMDKMIYPQMCVIRKGYFPQTSEGLDEVFCFVNLDFDLYQPTLAGLEYFYPRLVDNGIILVHDYFSKNYTGVQEAVKDFERNTKDIRKLPIGDGLSIAIFR